MTRKATKHKYRNLGCLVVFRVFTEGSCSFLCCTSVKSLNTTAENQWLCVIILLTVHDMFCVFLTESQLCVIRRLVLIPTGDGRRNCWQCLRRQLLTIRHLLPLSTCPSVTNQGLSTCLFLVETDEEVKLTKCRVCRTFTSTNINTTMTAYKLLHMEQYLF